VAIYSYSFSLCNALAAIEHFMEKVLKIYLVYLVIIFNKSFEGMLENLLEVFLWSANLKINPKSVLYLIEKWDILDTHHFWRGTDHGKDFCRWGLASISKQSAQFFRTVPEYVLYLLVWSIGHFLHLTLLRQWLLSLANFSRSFLFSLIVSFQVMASLSYFRWDP